MPRRPSAVAVALGLTATAGLGALAWGVLVERTRWAIRQEILPVLAPGARPITLLHLTDLHMAPWQRGKQDFVRSLARLEPDLIIDTGDNLGHPGGNAGIERAFERFRGIPGVFVHGSNDYVGPVLKNPLAYLARPAHDDTPARDGARRGERLDTAGMERFFIEELGWLDLNNTARGIEVRGTRIELIGTGDAHHHRDRADLLPGAIEQLREEVEWSETSHERVLTIGITHAPYRRVLDALANLGADLLVAGHTHGGQVRIPGLPALVTNCDLPRSQAQGVSRWRAPGGTAWLEVSAGLGTSITAPVRFACPPEAVVLTLVPAPA